jgi:UDP-glucose 4-epimerase
MSLQKKRILITGSEGFVGAHLVQRLEKEGSNIIPIDVSRGVDITDWEQVKDYHDIDAICHLAAKIFIPVTIDDPRETYLVNLVGTLNMLELGRRRKIKNFVFASSYVYGHPEYIPVNEEHPVNPMTPYSRSKALGEELCRAYFEDYGLKCTIIRAFNVYGEGQRNSFLIPSILKQIRSGEIELKDPEPRRDFLYVEDLVEAYIRATEYSGSRFEIFNIGSGVSYSVDEIVRAILDITKEKVKVRYLYKRRENEIMNTVADITKAKEKLGWEPKFSIEKGLRNTVQATFINHLSDNT